MFTNSSYVGVVVAALALQGACSFDPEPEAQTIFVRTSELVVLEAEPLPADSVYWLFSELPLPQSARNKTLTWLRAEFTPVLPGEYIVDRWVVSGPAGVWVDRFIVVVSGEAPVLVVDGPDELAVGQTGEFRVRTRDSSIDLVGLRIDCDLCYSEVGEYRGTNIGRFSSTSQTITFTPERLGGYHFSCDGFYDFGLTNEVEFEFNSSAE